MRVCSRGSHEYLIGARAHCATHTNMDMCTILSCAHQILSRAHQIFSREHQILARAHEKRYICFLPHVPYYQNTSRLRMEIHLP